MAEGNSPNKARHLVSLQKPVWPLDDMQLERIVGLHSILEMSAKEEKSAAAQDELGEVTTCCICDETYMDPRILPCVHTFCLACLQQIGTHTKKKPGDPMQCPICRQEFTIPKEGLAALKKNFFMVRLLDITTTAKQESLSSCDIHTKESLCLYCSECHEVVCLTCVREWHSNHRLSDLTSAADIFRSQLGSNTSTAKHCVTDALKKKESIKDTRCAVVEKVELLEREVRQAGCDLKALIDRHTVSLSQKLRSMLKEQLLDIDIEEKVLEKHMNRLKDLQLCCDELASNKRQDGLFCKMASKLRKEIVELKHQNETIMEHKLQSFEINFTSNLPKDESTNIVGTVKATIGYNGRPELIRTIEVNSVNVSRIISGIAVSYNDVFIVYENNPVISIYDAYTLKCTTQLTLEGLVDKADLRDCVHIDVYLYIVNGITSEILRMDYKRDFLKFSTGNDTGRLSVTKESTLVATCYETSMLKEYSLEGTLIQTIKLYRAIVHPQHAVKLGNGHFVVSHGAYGDAVRGVSIVDNVGSLMRSFGSRFSVSFFHPTCLAVDENENVLVLVRGNSCFSVYVLSPELDLKEKLFVEEDELQMAVAMHLDESTNELYIAENSGGEFHGCRSRVLVFNTI